MSFLIIDGDPLIYKFTHVNHEEFKWDDDNISVEDNLPKAKEGIKDYIEWLMNYLDGSDYILTFTDSAGNFRKKILPTYKHNRKSLEKPDLWYKVEEHIHSSYNSLLVDGLEADDLCGILGVDPEVGFKGMGLRVPQDEVTVVSIDKDFGTLPIVLFNPDKDEYERYISEDEAFKLFMYQTLTGDSTDGYKGCPGVGPVRANKLLDGINEKWEQWATVVDTYEQKGLTEEDALIQARMARILHTSDYNFTNNFPILWEPNF